MDKWRRGGLVVREAVIGDLDAIAKLERDSFPGTRCRGAPSPTPSARRSGR